MQKVNRFHSKKEYTYEVLRDQILNGDLAPGERLVIDEISSKLNVSSIPVREALQRLQIEGMVTIEPYVGARVAEIHAGLIHEIFGLLEATEVISSRAACQQMGDKDFAALERLLRQMDTCVDDVEEWSQQNANLHQFICERAGTSLVQRTMLPVLDHWNRLRHYYLESVSAQRVGTAQREHWEIFQALRSRDPDQVEAVVRRHNREALADYLKHLQKTGQL